MALKDLAASAESVNEEAIEAIIKDFVRFDIRAKSIVFTSGGDSMTTRQKLLTFLTANEGWCYVDDSVSTNPLLPKYLEVPLGVKGGSIRPAISKLVKENLVRKDGKGYRIVAANLSRIRSEVLG